LIRIEELYPFPSNRIIEILSNYKNAEILWTQEEPQNQGAWNFIKDFFEDLQGKCGTIKYNGRKKSASPAAGQLKLHLKEQEELVRLALTIE
jgi:2-oxoglutarate dehydrogenase E1 component